ncbi:MAG: ribosome maturation factor RimM [Bacteroidales bacterium]|nr:ribosome maturation factor RimM [Bacteroidales bacterium]MCF8457374.1 ribosome maturation factor RimM [Bacteroidales bacterium]
MLNTIQKANFVEIGTVRKSHGVNGAISIEMKDQKISIADEVDFLFLEIEGGLVPFSIDEMDIRGNSIVVELIEIVNKEKAAELSGYKAYISNEDLFFEESDTGYSMHSFVGFQISDKNKGLLPEITDLIEYPNNPVFEIILNGISVMIPAREELIELVDRENKILHLNLPEGLIDIYLE